MNLNPILYAEDEEDDVFLIRKAFEQAGIENKLVVVPDGTSAIDYLSGSGEYADRNKSPMPCLVLLDINLPGKTGLDVLKWIRSQPTICAMPTLMLTSSSHDTDIHRAYIQGANGFLQKPGQHDELLMMVKAIKDYWLMQNKPAREIAGSRPAI